MLKFDYQVADLDLKQVERALALSSDEMQHRAAKRGKEILDDQWVAGGTIEGAWDPLSKFTLDNKDSVFILYETGDLWSSTFYRKNEKGEWIFGVDDPKAVYHEYGFTNAQTGKWVPPRPMVGPALRQLLLEFSSLVKPVQKSFTEKIAEAFKW